MTELMDFFDALRIVDGTQRRIQYKTVEGWAHVDEIVLIFSDGTKQATISSTRKEKAWQVESEPEKLVDFPEALAAALKGDLIAPEGTDQWSFYRSFTEHTGRSCAVFVHHDDYEWWPTAAQIAGKWRVKPKEPEKQEDIFVWGLCFQNGTSYLSYTKPEIPDDLMQNTINALYTKALPDNLFPKDKPQKFILKPVED